MSRNLPACLLSLLLGLITAAASAQTLETAIMPGRVIQGHADLEGDCANCHRRFDRAAQTGLCMACHKDIGADVKAKRGHHGRLSEVECRTCHTDHKGRQARIVLLDERTFNHRQTDFALGGAHANAACKSCHKPGAKHREAPSACIACHRKDDRHKGSLGTECGSCHNDSNWKEARFDHDKTKFPLRAKHATAACTNCHINERYAGTPRDCASCHRKDDAHKGHFGAKCETCHREQEWKPATFAHDRDTRFALRGGHRTARCESCHRAPLYREKLKTTCVACHRADDVHQGGLGPRCDSCHSERSWKASSFNHDTETKFPLKGNHRSAKCQACHADRTLRDKPPRDCIGCHRKDDQDKGHVGRYGEKCETCHAESSWKAIHFRHDRDTKYPLLGAHARTRCDSCHRGMIYAEKPASQCIACHEKDDKHKAQLGPRCDSCHNERSWKETNFDHNRSRFPLTGNHARVECKACHATPAYKNAPMACSGCHDKDDVHGKRLGPKCETCHNTRDWRIWDFDHDRRTRFRLDGAHRKTGCIACHRNPVTDKPSLTAVCASCHTRDDVHNGQFGMQCQRCHGTTSWRVLNNRPGAVPAR